MKKISAVVFDFGGVMTTTIMPERVRGCVGELGVSWEVLENGYRRYRQLMDGGFITIDEMYDLIWGDAGVTVTPESRERIIKEDFASFLYRNERTLAWMRELKARGYRLGILTNMPPEFAGRFRETFGDFIAEAEAMVISGEERMFKPQPRIYELLRSRLGTASGEIVFIDDSPVNCEGARRAGWNAIRFVSNEQVEKDFECGTF